jgi:hypothetical protein
MHKKSFVSYASIVALTTAISATPGLARDSQKTTAMTANQMQSASSSYAFAPQTVAHAAQNGQCWIATDANRPYGYSGTCANPLAHDPSLDPTYNGELHGE